MAFIIAQPISTGSEVIPVATGMDIPASLTFFQVDSVGTTPWTGSLTPLRKIAGGVNQYQAAYVKLSDLTTQSGSITTTGIYSMDISGGDAFLSHSWTAGSVKISVSVCEG